MTKKTSSITPEDLTPDENNQAESTPENNTPENNQATVAPEDSTLENSQAAVATTEAVSLPNNATPTTDATDPDETTKAATDDIEQMLMFAWQRFNGYDEQSNKSKTHYRRFRDIIIIISLLTTLLAVVSSATIFPFVKNNTWFFKYFLVALPLLSAGLLTYVTRFESGNAWVGFRVSAENIRRGIYSLRVKARLEIATVKDLKLLDSLICDTSKTLETLGVTTPVLNPKITLSPTEIAPNWVDVPGEDNGYTFMSLDEYLNWRVIPQTKWYYRRIQRDYKLTRRWRAVILIIGGMGALVAAVGLTVWVAFVVALTTGLIALLGLRQYEVNYGNYMRTARNIEDALRSFTITFDNPHRTVEELNSEDKDKILEFVKKIENIFSEEREIWRFAILQSQEATESAIAQMVNTYNTPGFDADAMLAPSAKKDDTDDTDDEKEDDKIQLV
ncbi:SLATT domain-containing protein [Chloroflexota bacterium]